MKSEASRLLGEQYKDASNLNARLALHRRFSTNAQGWTAWLFDQMLAAAPKPTLRLFEVGCGPATLWRVNHARIPAGWSLTLSDFSIGMMSEARAALAKRAVFAVANVQDLPTRARFDVVVANHMLYHVPDRRRGIAELARITADDGCLVASTVGENHMVEIDARLRAFGITMPPLSGATQEFTIENGAAQLRASFEEVELLSYEDSLRVTEVEPLIAYIRSMRAGKALTEEILDQMRADFAGVIQREGCVSISKSSGVFVARRPKK